MTVVENTTPRESGKAMSLCLKNGIRIYPVPYGNRFKIVVERSGRPKKGEEIYPLKAEAAVPGVYDKIRDLYRQIAEKIEKPKPITQHI